MSTKPSIVSIVMSSYNNERDISKAINSVLSQTYPHWELVLSDDASTDKTKSIIDSFSDSRIKCYHSQDNQGIVKQMNMLFKYATGEFITILDADDMIDPKKLELQMKAFQDDSKLTLCLTRVAICDEFDQVLQEVNHYPENDRDIKKFIHDRKAFPCGNIACMMFRKNIIEQFGGYQNFYNGLGSWDIDLALRILSMPGSKVVTISHVLHFWRKHSHSFSRKVNMNPMKSQSHQFAHLLYQQRLKSYASNRQGLDDLTGLQSGELESLILKIRDDYKGDPSKILRETAKSKDQPKKVRIEYSLLAIKTDPFCLTNYRYLLKALLS